MASGSLREDPWDWSVHRVTQELSTTNRSWNPKYKQIPDPKMIEPLFIDNMVDGAMLLSEIDDQALKDIGIKVLAYRAYIRNAIDELRKQSTMYMRHIRAEVAVQARLANDINDIANAVSGAISSAVLTAARNLQSLRDNEMQTHASVPLAQRREADPPCSTYPSSALAAIEDAPPQDQFAKPSIAEPSIAQLLTTGKSLREAMETAPQAQIDEIRAALSAVDEKLASSKSHPTQMQLELVSRPASSQKEPSEHPDDPEAANRASQGTTLIPDEPSSKRQKLDAPADMSISSILQDEELAHGLTYAAVDHGEDLLEVRSQAPERSQDAEPASPNSDRKRKRSASVEEQELVPHNDDQLRPINTLTVSIGPDGKKRSTIINVSGYTPEELTKARVEAAERDRRGGLLPAMASHEYDDPSRGSTLQPDVAHDLLEQETADNPAGLEHPKNSSIHTYEDHQDGPSGENELGEQQAFAPTTADNRHTQVLAKSRPCEQQILSTAPARSYYLPKCKFPVDDIFYEGTAVGDDLKDADIDLEFSLSFRKISSSHRTYVHNCIKHFLHYKPHEVGTEEDRLTVVRPYRGDLVDIVPLQLQKQPSCTLFFRESDGAVHAARGLAPGFPELEESELRERRMRKRHGKEFAWPNADTLPGKVSTEYRGLMHPKSSRNPRGDAKFIVGQIQPRDYDHQLAYIQKKWENIPGGDELLPVFGESGSENEYDEATWNEISQEQGEKAMEAVRTMKKPIRGKPISLEEVNQVIDEALAVFKSRWREKHLPKLQTKAWGLWTKSRKQGSRDTQLDKAEEVLALRNKRLSEMRHELVSLEWASKSQARKVCGSMEHTIFDINESRWKISTLKQKSAPQKPPKKLPVSKPEKQPKQTADINDEGEDIGSGSEDEDVTDDSDDGLSDFVVSDDEVNLLELKIAGDKLAQQESAIAENEPSQVEAEADVEDEQEPEQQADITAHSSPDRPTSPEVDTPDLDDVFQSFDDESKLSILSEDGEPLPPPAKRTKTPIKGEISAQLTIITAPNGPNDSIYISSDDNNVINLITPDKPTPKLKLINRNSPLNSSPTREDKILDEDNLPPFNDPAAIDKYSYRAWAEIDDHHRLLIKVFYRMDPTFRTKLLEYFSTAEPDELWSEMMKVITAMVESEDVVDDMQPNEFIALSELIRLFHMFVTFQYSRQPWESMKHATKTDILREVLNRKSEHFISFYKLCYRMEEYLGHISQPSLPSTPLRLPRKETGKEVEADMDDDDESPRSSVKRRRTTTTSESEVHPEAYPSNNRKKRKVHVDVDALARRQDDKQRQIQQEERRKILQAKLALSGRAEDLDLARLVINSTDDPAKSIRICKHIAGSIKPHQIEGVRFLWNQITTRTDEAAMEGCLLAHTMGLGKTMQTITLLVAIAEAASSIDEAISNQIPKSLRVSRTLILCPPTLLDNWYDELLTWAPPDLLGEIHKFDSSVKGMKRIEMIKEWFEDGGILLMGYMMFQRFDAKKPGNFKNIDPEKVKIAVDQLLQGPNIVVADEAHMLKNTEAAVSKAALKFRTKSRIALTGSPLANKLEEYYAMINFVAPGYLGPLVEFRAKYVEPIATGLYEDSQSSERRKALKMLGVLNGDLAPKIHRADLSVIKNDLPPKKEFVITVPLTEIQRKAYVLYVRSMLENPTYARTKDGQITQTTIWHWLAILSLLCNHPSCFNEKLGERKKDAQKTLDPASGHPDSRDTTDADNGEDINAPVWKVGVSESLIAAATRLFQHEVSDLDAIDLSYKAKITCQILDAAKDAGDKTLVFSESIPTLNYLDKLCRNQGRNYARLDGRTNMAKRQQMTKTFNSGLADVYLISTGAGGLGLNLQSANRVIIFDFKFNPTKEEQAVGRAYRIGQQKPTYVYRFVTGGTFETFIHNKTIYKMQLASRVIDKKNPIASAKKSLGEYLFEPKDVPQSDLSEFKGMDPLVLDKILATQGQTRTICAIVQTDTFARDDLDIKFTPEEQKEMTRLQYESQLRRTDPKKWEALQQQQQRQPQYLQGPAVVPSMQGPIYPPGQFRRQLNTPSNTSAENQGQMRASASSGSFAQPSSILPPAQVAGPSASNGVSIAGVPRQAPANSSSVQRNDGMAPTNMTAALRNSSPQNTASPGTSKMPSSPILGASTRQEDDKNSSYPIPRMQLNDKANTLPGRQRVPGPVAQKQINPIPGSTPNQKVAQDKKPAMYHAHLLKAALETIEEDHRPPIDTPRLKSQEIQAWAHAKVPEKNDLLVLRRASYDELKKNPEKCRQIIASELSIEDFMRPLLSSISKPTPSSSSSNRQSQTGQSAMFTAMARQPTRPPVQNLRTPVTRPPKQNSSSSRNSLAKDDERAMATVNKNRRSRGEVELSKSTQSPARTPRIPGWAEKEINDTRMRRRQDSRASSRATPLPKKD